MPQNNVTEVDILNEADLNDIASPELSDKVHLTRGRSSTLENIKTAIGAEENVNADWNANSGDAQILNKPTIPTSASQLTFTPSGNVTSNNVQDAIVEIQTELDGKIVPPLLDEDDMSSDSATSTASQQSIKAYVDNQIATSSGDMQKSVYDSNDNGIVDNSQQLEGNGSSYHLNRANHTGTQAADTISNFDTEVSNNPSVTANTAKLSANTANVDAAGAVMNSDTSTSAMSFVVDEDDMVSNDDTKVPTQQSVKAYVDNSVANAGGGDMTKAVYDSGDNGVVDNSERLEGNDSAYHLNRNNHTGTQLASTISDFDAEVSANTNVAANTAKVSADGSISTHSDVDTAGAQEGEVLTLVSGTWEPATIAVGDVHTFQTYGKANILGNQDNITYTLASGVATITATNFGDISNAQIIVDRATDSNSDNYDLVITFSDNSVNTWDPNTGSAGHDLYIPKYHIYDLGATVSPLFQTNFTDKSHNPADQLVPSSIQFGSGSITFKFTSGSPFGSTNRILITLDFNKA